ncbi:transcriptional regulator [Photobacterium aquae]|uniref:Transcriptional regulator n=1 Tax=Photobacterium aquae TaxID=1195763 RepID=A0A0J1H6B2_9GAMM|nr:LysR family transcriptional regulator [Photobacterium aquae]KLV07260.1 transcriptional regulator [Photobacterium aquae]
MYNLEQLNMFVTAAKLGSFSACARKLGKVQSAVSQGIANLEIDLDVELFDRSTRKPTLTDQGKHLLSFAEAILMQKRELDSTAKALSAQQESQISLVVDDSLLKQRYYDIIFEFEQQFPSTSLRCFTAASVDIPHLVRDGVALLGVMLSEMSLVTDVDIRYIGNLKFVPVAAPSHPLSSLAQVTPTDLVPHRQILIQGLNGYHQTQLQPISSRQWSANDLRLLENYVIQGLGWAYLPKHRADELALASKVKLLPVTFDYKEWAVPIECLLKKGESLGPAASWLNQALNSLLPD